MKITDPNKLRSNFLPGDIVWGCRIPTENDDGIIPVKGVLSAYRYKKDNVETPTQYGDYIDYFIPFRSDGKTPSWKQAIKAYTMVYATTEDECKEIYNAALKYMIDTHKGQIKSLSARILK